MHGACGIQAGKPNYWQGSCCSNNECCLRCLKCVSLVQECT